MNQITQIVAATPPTATTLLFPIPPFITPHCFQPFQKTWKASHKSQEPPHKKGRVARHIINPERKQRKENN